MRRFVRTVGAGLKPTIFLFGVVALVHEAWQNFAHGNNVTRFWALLFILLALAIVLGNIKLDNRARAARK